LVRALHHLNRRDCKATTCGEGVEGRGYTRRPSEGRAVYRALFDDRKEVIIAFLSYFLLPTLLIRFNRRRT
jgi:hypothetical protein